MRASSFWLLILVPLCWADCPTDTFCEKEFHRCYKFMNDEIDFLSAEDICFGLGGHLTSIRNAIEGARVQETAKSMFVGLSDYWIGANHILNDYWSWTDGVSWKYTHWSPGGESDKGAASVSLETGLWSAAAEGLSKPFVCALPYVSPKPTVCPVCPTAPTTCPRRGLCDDGWVHFGKTNSCYKVIHHYDFASAEQVCVDNGAHLASIHSDDENMFIAEFTSAWSVTPGVEIGLHNVFNVWQWSDGTPVTYINWAPGEPDKQNNDMNCVQLTFLVNSVGEPYANWNNIPCAWRVAGAVCKKRELN